jgi:hypothetical protein
VRPTNKTIGLLGLLLAILAGCGDPKVAGGSGSDFPQPVARLLDTNYAPVQAPVWRLWKIEGDSARADHQVLDSSGFPVPGSGLWIVEAWPDTTSAGPLSGLSKSRFADTSCVRLLTHIAGEAANQFGVIPCKDLPPPSMKTRPTLHPLGVGVFGAVDTAHRIVTVPGGSASYRFLLWSVRWDTVKLPIPSPPATVRGSDSILIVLADRKLSDLRGSFDMALPAGDWYVEGWTAGLDDTLGRYDWTYPPSYRWVDSLLLDTCFANLSPPSQVSNCPTSISTSPWHKEADAHFVVRVR